MRRLLTTSVAKQASGRLRSPVLIKTAIDSDLLLGSITSYQKIVAKLQL